MTRREPDPGCDGMDSLELFLLAQEAARAHPPHVPPPTPFEVALNLDLLRRGLAAGECGGVREGAP